MHRSILVFAAGLSGVAVVSNCAHAQYKVGIAAAASATPTACQFTDVVNNLTATGLFAAVDIINVTSATPDLTTLQQYDVVMTWSNVNYSNAAAMGDVLADYVDAGGAVVVTVFANSTTTASRFLTGRWQPDYEVVVAQGGTTSGSASLGTILVPGHPILDGVATFEGGTSSFRPTNIAVQPGSTRIAEWSDGKTLVAVGANPARVDLGMYPPSSACSSTFWNPATDGVKLMANALIFAADNAGGSSPCYADCDASGGLNIDDFICFQTFYALGDLYADCDTSGQLNIDDFICFQTFYALGC